MHKQFIKEWLLTGQLRVYSVIVSTYYDTLEELKPSLFRKWLSNEIDVPEEKINLSSLNSALVRHRKKLSLEKQKGKKLPVAKEQSKQSSPQASTFNFSKTDELPSKRNIIEM